MVMHERARVRQTHFREQEGSGREKREKEAVRTQVGVCFGGGRREEIRITLEAGVWFGSFVFVSVFVCLFERERERERELLWR